MELPPGIAGWVLWGFGRFEFEQQLQRCHSRTMCDASYAFAKLFLISCHLRSQATNMYYLCFCATTAVHVAAVFGPPGFHGIISHVL